MPNFEGTWKMRSSENFDELLKALGENNLLFFFCRSESVSVRENKRLNPVYFLSGLLIRLNLCF